MITLRNVPLFKFLGEFRVNAVDLGKRRFAEYGGQLTRVLAAGVGGEQLVHVAGVILTRASGADALVFQTRKRRKNVYALLEVLKDRAPVYFVEGNHEAEIGHWDSIKIELTDRGVRVLDNEVVTLVREDEQLVLRGIREEASPEEFEGLIQKDRCAILLAHHPERIEEYAKTGVDLVLSGHAHGGQVRIFGQGLYSPDQGILPRYTSGVYARGRTRLYVSRGAGTHSFLPPRIFNRPEIDIITLKTPSR